MNTMQAEYETGFARIDANLSEMKAEGAKRETNMVRTMVALVIGVVGLATAFLGILITVLFNS